MGTTAVAEVLEKAPPALRSGSEPALRQISAPVIVAPAAKGGRRKTLRRLALAAGLIAAVVGGGWYGEYWWTTGRFIESTDDAYVGGNITPLAPHVDGFIARRAGDRQPARARRPGADRARSPRLPDRARPRAGGAEARTAAPRACAPNTRCSNPRSGSRKPTSSPRRRRRPSPPRMRRAPIVLAQTSSGSRQNEEHNVALEQEAQAAVTVAQAALEAANQQLKVLDAQIAQAEAAVAQAEADLHTAAAQPRLHRDPLADRRLCRQSRRLRSAPT